MLTIYNYTHTDTRRQQHDSEYITRRPCWGQLITSLTGFSGKSNHRVTVSPVADVVLERQEVKQQLQRIISMSNVTHVQSRITEGKYIGHVAKQRWKQMGMLMCNLDYSCNVSGLVVLLFIKYHLI